jgi:hypothetical protein
MAIILLHDRHLRNARYTKARQKINIKINTDMHLTHAIKLYIKLYEKNEGRMAQCWEKSAIISLS